MGFSDRYGYLRARAAHESAEPLPEHVLQCVWYDQLFNGENLLLADGRPLHVLSPGWWNQSEGPDFRDAQLEINNRLRTGDVEVHLSCASWKQHGHHLDSRYDGVVLHVVLDDCPPIEALLTSAGRTVPTLLLKNYLDRDLHELARVLPFDGYPVASISAPGACAALFEGYGPERLLSLLNLVGEWRMLSKAQMIRDRIDRVGADQAIYEAFLTACGYSQYKRLFRSIAEQIHYDRIRQLAREDALLVEAALLKIACLLPDALPNEGSAADHFMKVSVLRNEHLAGLRSLPFQWRKTGVRPANYPERRLAGAARFLSRTAKAGLARTLEDIWRASLSPAARRREFERLFPGPVGYWSIHCSWTDNPMRKPTAPLGRGRVLSIIGNVVVPAALALARQQKDHLREESVRVLFASLPKEAPNHVLRAMIPRIYGVGARPRLKFQAQQGLLQLYQDWCGANRSCRNCPLLAFLRAFDHCEE
jgi:hypothetical protein